MRGKPLYAPGIDEVRLETELRAVAHAIAGRLPPPWRHPERTGQDLLMSAAGREPGVRAALFRLVDVAPACADRDDLGQHLHALLAESGGTSAPVRAAVTLGARRRTRRLLGAATSPGVRAMARRFIVGRDPTDAAGVLADLYGRGVAVTVDLLGEATVTDAEAEAYTRRCHEALDAMAAQAATWPSRPQLEADGAGPTPRANLSVKVSAMTARMRPHDPERGVADVEPRLRELLRRARDLGAHVHVDMESADTREAIVELVMRLIAEPEFAEGPSLGCVQQAYLLGAEDDLDRLLAAARAHPRATPLTVRLVKGAYWDHETVEARLHGWTPPVHLVKADTDRAFERLTRKLIDAGPVLRPAIASHNLRSIAHAIAYNRQAGRRDEDIELQVLRGLGDDLQDALASLRLRVRTYCPLGDLVAGMAYLVRRLLENTSNDSFLAMRAAGADLDTLLAAP